jgi:fucose permease
LSIALINTHLCRYFDLGLLLAVGAALQLIAQVLRSWLPPFLLFAVTFFVQSLGMALQDTHSNNFVTGIKTAHRWLGFIHAMYALGTLIGPTVATAIASADDPSRWYLFYTSLIAVGSVNMVLVVVAFRDSIALKRKNAGPRTEATDLQKPSALGEMKAVLRLPSVWLLALYFFFFLGAVITASGWVVEYLVTVRGGKLSEVGYVQTGFAGGTFLGRLLLAEPTKRLGERRMVFVYALLCLGLELLFWLVPNIIAGAVAISLFGFFAGPFFATGVSVGAQIFPPELRSSSLGE